MADDDAKIDPVDAIFDDLANMQDAPATEDDYSDADMFAIIDRADIDADLNDEE